MAERRVRPRPADGDDDAGERRPRRCSGERGNSGTPRRSAPTAAGWRSSPIPAIWWRATRTARSMRSSTTGRPGRRRASAWGPGAPRGTAPARISPCDQRAMAAGWRSFPLPAIWWRATPTASRTSSCTTGKRGRRRASSVGPGGVQGNGGSIIPSISGDGRWVAFASDASNLVNGDTNNRADVFAHDRTGPMPPAPPEGLVASSVTGSVVTLRWTIPSAARYRPSFPLEGGLSPERCWRASPRDRRRPRSRSRRPPGRSTFASTP